LLSVNIQTAKLQLSTEMNVGLHAQFRYRNCNSVKIRSTVLRTVQANRKKCRN